MTFKASVEDIAELTWIKSSHSTSEGPECVEVASVVDVVCVRDSKNAYGPRLAFSSAAWSTLVTSAVGCR